MSLNRHIPVPCNFKINFQRWMPIKFQQEVTNFFSVINYPPDIEKQNHKLETSGKLPRGLSFPNTSILTSIFNLLYDMSPFLA